MWEVPCISISTPGRVLALTPLTVWEVRKRLAVAHSKAECRSADAVMGHVYGALLEAVLVVQ